MTTHQRLEGLKNWCEKELCRGRLMKAPADDGDLKKWAWVEPKCFINYYPVLTPSDFSEFYVAPSILICQGLGRIKFTEEEKYDQYRSISRPQELGQSLPVTLIFSVYDQGTRLPGFIPQLREGNFDEDLIVEGTQAGMETLNRWMDEAMRKLIGQGHVPGTDLFLNRKIEDGCYGPLQEAHYVKDMRPSYIGLIQAEYNCYAEEEPSEEILRCLL